MLSHQDDSQTIGSGGSGGGGGGGGGRNTSLLKPPEQIIKCPRCDSPNTKFCYYNNYSLAQPRYYCKACRRYWTKGGALRNVPIGGTCRKSKKTKACSSRFLSPESLVKCSSSDIGRMKVFGLSTLDFQLGGLNNLPPRPVVTPANQLCSSSYGDHVSSDHSLVNLDPLGYNINLPFSSSQIVMKQEHHHHNHHHQQQDNGNGELGSFHDMGTNHTSTDLASSIESLSSINQDLHWKLQQQRLAMLFGGGVNGGGGVGNDQQQQNTQVVLEPHHEKLQPILFQNLETSKQPQSSIDGDSRKYTTGGSCGLATEWFFDNSYAPVNRNPATSRNGNGEGNDQNGSMNNWNGVQDWNHLNQYNSVP